MAFSFRNREEMEAAIYDAAVLLLAAHDHGQALPLQLSDQAVTDLRENLHRITFGQRCRTKVGAPVPSPIVNNC